MYINERDYITATHNSYGDDPTKYNGHEPDNCKLCDMEPKAHDTDLCDGCIDEMEEGKRYEGTDICLTHYKNNCKICEKNNIDLQMYIEDAENLTE